MDDFDLPQEKSEQFLDGKPLRFLDVSLDIRLRVFGLCLPRRRIVYANGPSFNVVSPFVSEGDFPPVDRGDESQGFGINVANDIQSSNGLFLVSRQVSDEALNVFYGQNLFQLYLHAEGDILLQKNFSECNRKRIRHLLVVLQPPGFLIHSGWKPDHRIWSSILPNLKTFRFVAQEPLAGADFHDVLSYEQAMDMWLIWINPLLRCFGQHLQPSTTVHVDFDENEEIGGLIKDHFTCNYHTIQCHIVGDRLFQRGQFAIDSEFSEDVMVMSD